MALKVCYTVIFLLCSLLILTVQSQFDEASPVVQTQQGSVQGLVRTTAEGNEFYAFLGIPFGKPPVGDLRYKAPVPADAWTGIFQAVEDPPMCIQPQWTVPISSVGKEDCLQLNVYSPSVPDLDAASLPVQVFIHGGAYFGGGIASTDLGPERYMDTPMVLVLMNYRLSALGFLSTGDDAANGNFGLLDQNLALQWVQQNIAAFGGNPDQVTLTGQSAGSSSVLTHIVSPMSNGLFQQAIAESGSVICPWALEENPLYFAKALGERLGCPTDDNVELIDCLRLQDAGETQAKSVDVMIANLTLAFVPVVENAETGLFLTEDPTLLLTEGRFNQVPLILGFNHDEGVLIYEFVFFLCENINDAFFDDIMPLLVKVLTDYRQNLVNVSYAIKDEYYTGLDINNKTAVDITNINVLSDMFMKVWVAKTAELISSHDVPAYLYAFNYVSSVSSSDFTGAPDVTHGSEMKYLFNTTVLSDKDRTWGPQFFDHWVNFITQGVPDPSTLQWVPNTSGGSTYLEINEVFTLFNEYDPEIMEFWFTEVPAIVNG